MKSEFRERLEKMFDANMQGDTLANGADADSYKQQASVRNVCFLPKDGNAKFLNYAFLVSGEYDPENGTIILSFTTDTITIKGNGLDSTFWAFMEHIPRKVFCTEERYRSILQDTDFDINEITIVKT